MKKNIKLITLIFGTIILLCICLCGQFTHEKFNSKKWKNADQNLEENWSIRWDMMNSLRNEKELIGKSYEEIITILGKPDNESKTELYYSLGYTGNGINTGNLKIEINTEKKVTNIKVSEG
ncbi:hypothetical protein [Flavobacterium salmonis]|uniref:SmpA / OmlA family protein n=1 Tax=Flavobacterium salmonis TaxID=2654844 RepID=A0A6V6Z6Q7_9FLAO|nr:hypothetical protein [Flavobacterium salmonis]CAD0007124.1 hypothetical protein FLAT13_03656 [Flavobacterium salmonis]